MSVVATPPMRILFITAHPYLPQMYGGLQTSTNALCLHLHERGHHVAVLGALMPHDVLGRVARYKLRFRKVLGRPPVTRDHVCGYPVWRAWFPDQVVRTVIQREQPDVVVVLAVKPVLMALAAQPAGVPIIMKLQDVEFDQHGGAFEALGPVAAVANSQFTAKTYRDAYGIDPAVIYPFVYAQKFGQPTSRENVTFINPHAFKGLQIALGVARACPDIPFVFIETWPLKPDERRALAAEMASLPNVTLRKPQKNMSAVYGKCKILLVPSLWYEGYGKVVTEAALSGIPAVASRLGGLPEAVGPGGILVDPKGPLAPWIAAIRLLWTNDTEYQKVSAAALTHATRLELSTAGQIAAWESLLGAVIARSQQTTRQ